MAYLDDNEEIAGSDLLGVPVQKIEDAALANYLDQNGIDELWVALPLRAEQRVEEIMQALRDSTVNIRYIPDIYNLRLLNYAMTEVAGFPMLELSSSPMTGTNRVIKGIEDYLLSLIILVLASPLMLAEGWRLKRLTSWGPSVSSTLTTAPMGPMPPEALRT